MVRRAFLAALIVAGAVAASIVSVALSSDRSPALTVKGAATLWTSWSLPMTMEGEHSDVLMGATVRVGRGGRAGPVRVRIIRGGAFPDGPRITLGRWTWLPARPGRYRLAAPRVHWDYRMEIALDQRLGGHAILQSSPCDLDVDVPCAPTLQTFAPMLGTHVEPSRARSSTQAPDTRLAVGPISEPDRDRDLVGDRTEDRTDLRLHVRRTRRGALTLIVHNAGPRTADQSLITLRSAGRHEVGRWARRCPGWDPLSREVSGHPDARGGLRCALRPLPPGGTSRVTLLDPAPGLTLDVAGEGPDRRPVDNRVAE